MLKLSSAQPLLNNSEASALDPVRMCKRYQMIRGALFWVVSLSLDRSDKGEADSHNERVCWMSHLCHGSRRRCRACRLAASWQ